jgi:hypothetical protein
LVVPRFAGRKFLLRETTDKEKRENKMRKPLTLKLALILTLAIAACGAIVQQSAAADNSSIDEKAFKKALSNWTDYRDGIIGKFSEMSQEEADAAYFDEDSELNKMGDSEELRILEESIRPVLYHYGSDQETLNDREVLALVVNSGIFIDTSEGDPDLIPDDKFLHGLIKHRLSGDAQAYMAAADLEPPSFYSDGGLAYSVEEMGDWAVAWETFISEHPDNRHKERAAERYEFFMKNIFFCELDNTRTFSFSSGSEGMMEEYWIKGLNAVAAKHKGTVTASLVSEYVTAVKRNGRKFSQSTQNKFWQKIASAFVEVDKVRLYVTGDNVNIRPKPDAKSGVLSKVSAESGVYFQRSGVYFIAEAETLTDATGMDWYRIVYIVEYIGDGKRAYRTTKEWLGQNAVYISSNYVSVSYLDERDKEILKGR